MEELVKVATEETGKVCQWWEASLRLVMPLNHYRFFMLTPHGGWWYSAGGMTRYTPTDTNDFKILADYTVPDWVRKSVFYQIFPDRFADGDPSNNVRDHEYLYHGRPVVARQWGEKPNGARGQGGLEFFGGDLSGITQKLAYLADLGVNALYLTPIFTAPSNHKYDVADYRNVDKHFGGNEALVELRQALSQYGMRLMLDIVPNHCGATHLWFEQAKADQSAETTEYFTFHRHPEDYESWFGVPTLPKLNYRSLALRQEMYAGPEAIMRQWLRPPYQIDGWRVDVANMLGRQGETQLGHEVLEGMHMALKEEDPEAYFLGEHFHDATSHLQGDELDACMNYRGFSIPLLRWLSGFDPSSSRSRPYADSHPLPTEALAAQWQTFRAAIPWQIALQQFNLLGSHDTPRVLTAMHNDLGLAKIAAALLVAYPGIPCIYYGDEIGMEGGPDPDNRRCMIWETENWNQELREFYRRLIELRKSLPVLSEGGFQLLWAAEETLAFQREMPGEKLIVVAWRGPENLAVLPVRQANLLDGTRLRDLLSGAEVTIKEGYLYLSDLSRCGVQFWYVQLDQEVVF